GGVSGAPPKKVVACVRQATLVDGLRRRGLEDREVAVELPAGDLDPVVVPLLALDLDVPVEGVLAERPKGELGFGGQLDRLTQGLGQLLDPEPAGVIW